jgi:predicted 2-oxoglutarate/Fe(II)-dependent dioxygenase YbiX
LKIIEEEKIEEERKNHTHEAADVADGRADEGGAPAGVKHQVAVVQMSETAVEAVAVDNTDNLEDSAVGFVRSKLPCHPLKFDCSSNNKP